MRRRLVVGNWKMNPVTLAEAIDLTRAVAGMPRGDVHVGVAPPAVFLDRVAEAARGSHIGVYAQDVHWDDRGAFTGQLSAQQAAAFAHGSIVGHSEVRRDQGDDDARVARKATAALRLMSVIYCVGESLEQRRAGDTDAVLRRQVRDGIGAIPREVIANDRLILAYEPVWAIGTGVVATPGQASAAIATLRRELTAIGLDGAAATILYGGSVSAINCAECAAAEGVDGALVGGASLKADEFAKIVAAFS